MMHHSKFSLQVQYKWASLRFTLPSGKNTPNASSCCWLRAATSTSATTTAFLRFTLPPRRATPSASSCCLAPVLTRAEVGKALLHWISHAKSNTLSVRDCLKPRLLETFCFRYVSLALHHFLFHLILSSIVLASSATIPSLSFE